MQLQRLIPIDLHADAGAGVRALLRWHLVRANMVPGLRHAMGWRGLHNIAGADDAWTARVAGCPGVFGVFPDGAETRAGWTVGRFGLNYFPHPDEDCVESLCVQAGVLTQQPDYHDRLRDFITDPQLVAQFNIAMLSLAITPASDRFRVALQSVTRQRVVSASGVVLAVDGRAVQVVAPGGIDQNFPAFDTAMAFFEVFGGAVTFNLGAPPEQASVHARPGQVRRVDAAGNVTAQPSDTIRELCLTLGYGTDDNPDRHPAAVTRAARSGDWQADESMAARFADAMWWRAHQLRAGNALDKQLLGIDERPRFIVVSGYLGAGKTSFLQHFIEHETRNNRFVAVIQNEIGAVGLDGKLLGQSYAVTEIDEGCICCSLVGSVKTALAQIAAEFHPDTILLETTGLANPLNLMDELAEVAGMVRVDAVTTVVDGKNLPAVLAASPVAHDQIRAADIVLLNKTDLLASGEIATCEQTIARLNPRAMVLQTVNGDVNPALIFGLDPVPGAAAEACSNGAGRHHTHLVERIETHTVHFNAPVSLAWLQQALAAAPVGIFRIKGVLDIIDAQVPRLVQYVAGRYDISDYREPHDMDRCLVFIGRRIDREDLDRRFDPSVPTPAAGEDSALTGNGGGMRCSLHKGG